MSKLKLSKMVLFLVIGFIAAVIFAGCSLSGDSTVSGTASKGPIDSATVSVYVLNSDGTRGTLLGSATTDANGNYSLSVSYTGAVAVVITGGTYVDEASGDTVTLSGSDELVTLLDSVVTSGQNVAVTALTTIAAEQAIANAGSGIETAIAAANLAVASEFGITGMDITSVLPVDPTDPASATASLASLAYSIVLASLTQLAADDAGMTSSDVLTMIQEFAADYSDGTLDGTNAAGDTLVFASGITPTNAMGGLSTAMASFFTNPRNQTGLTIMPSSF